MKYKNKIWSSRKAKNFISFVSLSSAVFGGILIFMALNWLLEIIDKKVFIGHGEIFVGVFLANFIIGSLTALFGRTAIGWQQIQW